MHSLLEFFCFSEQHVAVAAILYATFLFPAYVIVEGKSQSHFSALPIGFPSGDGSGMGCSVSGYRNLPASNSV